MERDEKRRKRGHLDEFNLLLEYGEIFYLYLCAQKRHRNYDVKILEGNARMTLDFFFVTKKKRQQREQKLILYLLLGQTN